MCVNPSLVLSRTTDRAVLCGARRERTVTELLTAEGGTRSPDAPSGRVKQYISGSNAVPIVSNSVSASVSRRMPSGKKCAYEINVGGIASALDTGSMITILP